MIPPPSTPLPAAAEAFGVAMHWTGYMLPLIKGTEVLAGSLLLANCLLYLAWVYRSAYAALFVRRATPAV